MDFISVVLLAVALAMDCFSVSLANGTRMPALKARPVVELAFFMGLFQALMPVIGWFLGSRFLRWIGAFDHWVAFGLLFFLGVKMCVDALRPEKTDAAEPFRQSFAQVMLMSVATSIDALAVGVSFAMIEMSISMPVVVIGLVSSVFSVTGSAIGYRFGQVKWFNARLVGGLMLIAIGVKILLSHLLA
ncbi:MAG: manganese efflux pump [Bacteroidales bacterium]|nr:manganese efflux pump [Bacteroidales bacterium]